MSSETPERLAMMANQIARAFAHEADPEAATAAHLQRFWTLAMIRQLAESGAPLSPVAQAALTRL